MTMAPNQSRVMRRHTDVVFSLAFSFCGNFGYSGGMDRRLVMWAMRTGDVVSERTDAHIKEISRMAAAASGAYLHDAEGGEDAPTDCCSSVNEFFRDVVVVGRTHHVENGNGPLVREVVY